MEPSRRLNRFANNVHSQNGEDGILKELLARLGLTHGLCVEFGAWDGRHLSNTFHLVEQGLFRAVYIEGDAERFGALQQTAAAMDGRITAVQRFVAVEGPDRLDAILAEHDVPAEFDLLSIDIDSWDYHVWSSVRHYAPLIVIVEINSSFPPGIHLVHAPPHVHGSSFSAMLELGRARGYTLVCHTGNMLFVRNDRAGEVGLDNCFLRHPELLFLPHWLGPPPSIWRRLGRLSKRLQSGLRERRVP